VRKKYIYSIFPLLTSRKFQVEENSARGKFNKFSLLWRRGESQQPQDLTAHNIAHYFEILECFFTFFRERYRGRQGLSNKCKLHK
jgi:hypothetical protein